MLTKTLAVSLFYYEELRQFILNQKLINNNNNVFIKERKIHYQIEIINHKYLEPSFSPKEQNRGLYTRLNTVRFSFGA